MNAFVGLQMVLSGFILYACFCRLVFTNRRTLPTVRWAIWFKAVASLLVMGAPVWPLLHPARITWQAWTTPEWVWVTLLVSVVVVQAVQSRFWTNGVPCFLQRPEGDAL